MTRKCSVCKGSGQLWTTPRTTPEDGFEGRSWGIDLTCWRCLGSGNVPDERKDNGELNS